MPLSDLDIARAVDRRDVIELAKSEAIGSQREALEDRIEKDMDTAWKALCRALMIDPKHLEDLHDRIVCAVADHRMTTY